MTIAELFEKRGMERGMERGIECGMERGSHQAREELARNLLKEGDKLSLEKIAELTELKYEEIQALAEKKIKNNLEILNAFELRNSAPQKPGEPKKRGIIQKHN